MIVSDSVTNDNREIINSSSRPQQLTFEWSPGGRAQARQWNRYQTQVCGSPCISDDRRHRGELGGILQVGIGLGFPLLGQRSKSRALRGVPSRLRWCVKVKNERYVSSRRILNEFDDTVGDAGRCRLAPVDSQTLGREAKDTPTLYDSSRGSR